MEVSYSPLCRLKGVEKNEFITFIFNLFIVQKKKAVKKNLKKNRIMKTAKNLTVTLKLKIVTVKQTIM